MSRHKPIKAKDKYFGHYKEVVTDIAQGISSWDQEAFLVVTLNDSNFEIGQHMVALGDYRDCTPNISIIMNRIIMDKADKFVIAHNHNRGVRAFSKDDFMITISLLCVSDLMRIELVDHLLFPYEKEPLSMRQSHPKLFDYAWANEFRTMIKNYVPKC